MVLWEGAECYKLSGAEGNFVRRRRGEADARPLVVRRDQARREVERGFRAPQGARGARGDPRRDGGPRSHRGDRPRSSARREARGRPLRLHTQRRPHLQDRELLSAALSARTDRRHRSRARARGRGSSLAPARGGTAAALLPGRAGDGRPSPRLRPRPSRMMRPPRGTRLDEPMYALNFYSPMVADQLRSHRKTATIRLGDKSAKYRKGMIVQVLAGTRYSPREKVFDAVIDKVDVKTLAELSPREIEHDNPEMRRPEDMALFLGQLYNREVLPDDTVTVIRFSQIKP